MDELPVEMVLKIMGNIEGKDLISFSLTSKRYRLILINSGFREKIEYLWNRKEIFKNNKSLSLPTSLFVLILTSEKVRQWNERNDEKEKDTRGPSPSNFGWNCMYSYSEQQWIYYNFSYKIEVDLVARYPIKFLFK